MEEQKVYVVYKDGQVYQDSGKKIAYLQERYAKQLVTTASKKDAEFLYEPTRFNGKEMIRSIRFSQLNKAEKKQWIDKARSFYEIKVFTDESQIDYKILKNESLRLIYKDIQEHKEFGSLFQFWVSQVISELENNTSLKDDEMHNLAINIVKRIASDD